MFLALGRTRFGHYRVLGLVITSVTTGVYFHVSSYAFTYYVIQHSHVRVRSIDMFGETAPVSILGPHTPEFQSEQE